MALAVTHSTVVATADDGTSEVGSDEWNAAHTLSGIASAAQGGFGADVSALSGVPLFATGVPTFTSTTGTGDFVRVTSPTLVTPILGTPTSVTLTNGTGLPIATGVSGLGTGVATALAVNTGSAGAVVLFNGALGTPSAATLTNATGLPISTGVSGLGANVATFLATPSSANLASALTDETGSGAAVFGTSPSITTPSFPSYVDFTEIAAPSNPGANVSRVYSKDYSGKTQLYFRDSAGIETPLGGAGVVLVGWVDVDFNAANTDHLITIQAPASRWRIDSAFLINTGTTASITTARGGMFTATGAGGDTIVTDAALSGLTSNAVNTAGNSVGLTIALSTRYVDYAQLYWRTSTAQGAAASGRVYVLGRPLP